MTTGTAGLRWRRANEGEMHATPVTTLLLGGARGMRSSARGGASPSHPIRGKLWSRSRAFRQPDGLRQRGAAECDRAE